MGLRFGIGILLFLSMGCGEDASQPVALVRLFSSHPNHFKSKEPRVVHHFDFADSREPWKCQPESIAKRVQEDEQAFLRFGEQKGLAWARVEVPKAGRYRVSVQQRSTDDASGFAWATLGKIPHRDGSPAFLRSVWEQKKEGLTPRKEENGWMMRSTAIIVPEDRLEIIVVLCGTDRKGIVVDYDNVMVEASSLQAEVLDHAGRGATEQQRVLFDSLETWAIPMNPGTQLDDWVQVPSQDPVLEFLLAGFGEDSTFEFRVDQQELSLIPVKGSRKISDSQWQHHSISLQSFAGKDIRLSGLAPEDRDAVVFLGAPRIVSRAPSRPNVIMISLDTLRADHTSLYGYPKATTPRLDKFAQQGALIQRAYATSSWTIPSHVSLFASQQAATHGSETRHSPMHPSVSPHLAEILSQQGYDTRAYTSGRMLHPSFGFSRGFDSYGIQDPFCDGFIPDPSSAAFKSLLEDLRTLRNRPFFLFLHTYGCHEFEPDDQDLRAFDPTLTRVDNEEFRKKWIHVRSRGNDSQRKPYLDQASILRNLYDATVLGVDRVLGTLFDFLERQGLLENTYVIVFSDHGEALGEHGDFYHAYTLYEELIRIPLIWRGPRIVPNAKIPQPMSLIDIAPTLLHLLGLEEHIDSRMQGHDRSQWLLGKAQEVQEIPLFARVVTRSQEQSAIIQDGHKVLWETKDRESSAMGFDLKQDPFELSAVEITQSPYAELFGSLESSEKIFEELCTQWRPKDQSFNLSPSLAEELEVLGYTDESEDRNP